jgi:hypothetical protein
MAMIFCLHLLVTIWTTVYLENGGAHDAVSHHEGEQTDVRKQKGDDTPRHL